LEEKKNFHNVLLILTVATINLLLHIRHGYPNILQLFTPTLAIVRLPILATRLLTLEIRRMRTYTINLFHHLRRRALPYRL